MFRLRERENEHLTTMKTAEELLLNLLTSDTGCRTWDGRRYYFKHTNMINVLTRGLSMSCYRCAVVPLCRCAVACRRQAGSMQGPMFMPSFTLFLFFKLFPRKKHGRC